MAKTGIVCQAVDAINLQYHTATTGIQGIPLGQGVSQLVHHAGHQVILRKPGVAVLAPVLVQSVRPEPRPLAAAILLHTPGQDNIGIIAAGGSPDLTEKSPPDFGARQAGSVFKVQQRVQQG